MFLSHHHRPIEPKELCCTPGLRFFLLLEGTAISAFKKSPLLNVKGSGYIQTKGRAVLSVSPLDSEALVTWLLEELGGDQVTERAGPQV